MSLLFPRHDLPKYVIDCKTLFLSHTTAGDFPQTVKAILSFDHIMPLIKQTQKECAYESIM